MSGPFADSIAVADFYSELLAEHGDSHQAVGWENLHVQLASFFQILKTDGFQSGVSVLDIGCGLGHFKGFLDAQGIEVDYTGWDICAPMVERATELYPCARFECRDIVAEPAPVPQAGKFDFVVCSGALTIKIAEHEAWVADMIRAMFRHCRRGLVFNLLSYYYAHDNPLATDPVRYYHAQPERIMAFCLELSRQVTIDHCALAQSFAVWVYKSNTTAIEQLASRIAPSRKFGPEHNKIIAYYESFGMGEELLAYLDSLEPSAPVYNQIGLNAFLVGDRERMLQAFEGAVDFDPDNPEYRLHLAIAHMQVENNDTALPHLVHARAVAPDDVDVAYRLGLCRERLDDFDGAEACYRAALDLRAGHKSASAGLERIASLRRAESD